MNNFYYGNDNMPIVNNILGLNNDDDEDTPEPAPVIPKELRNDLDFSNKELLKQSFNRDRNINF